MGCGCWTREQPHWWGPGLPQLPEPEGTDSHPKSHSIGMAILNENWVISRLPVPPSRVLSVQQICCSHLSLASASGFPSRDRAGWPRAVFPAPQLRKFRTQTPLPSLPPPLRTHMYTHQSPFTTLPTSPHKPPPPLLFSTSSLAPRAGRSPQDHWFFPPPRAVAWTSSVKSQPRHPHPLLKHRQGWGVYYLPRLLPLDCSGYTISSIYRRGFPGVLSMAPTGLVASLGVKTTCCLALRPVTPRLKNSRASRRFHCAVVCYPFTVHRTFLSAPSRLRQGRCSHRLTDTHHSTHQSTPHAQTSRSRPVLAAGL